VLEDHTSVYAQIEVHTAAHGSRGSLPPLLFDQYAAAPVGVQSRCLTLK